jgi:hypothetical protein
MAQAVAWQCTIHHATSGPADGMRDIAHLPDHPAIGSRLPSPPDSDACSLRRGNKQAAFQRGASEYIIKVHRGRTLTCARSEDGSGQCRVYIYIYM